MDPDQVPTAGGSEVSNDPSVPVKNARLDSLSELTFVTNWTSPTGPRPLPLLGGLSAEAPQGEEMQESQTEDFQGEAPVKDASVSSWTDWLSLYSEGKVNINTAPREILLALDEQMTDALVEEIVRKREEGSLSGEEDLRQIATIDEDLLFRLSRLIRYNSQYFRVRITVSSPPGPVRVDAVVLRDRKNPKVVQWEVY
jgi:general secretion pathway protein K